VQKPAALGASAVAERAVDASVSDEDSTMKTCGWRGDSSDRRTHPNGLSKPRTTSPVRAISPFNAQKRAVIAPQRKVCIREDRSKTLGRRALPLGCAFSCRKHLSLCARVATNDIPRWACRNASLAEVYAIDDRGEHDL